MSRQCTAHRSDGEQCKNRPVRGALVCHKHGAAAPHVKANAAVRAELANWGLGNSDIDPGETLLRLLTQSVQRAERYAAEVQRMVDEHGIQEALVGDNLIQQPETGALTKVGEYVRGLATLEERERDRAARIAEKAVAAGLAERQVRLAERQGAMIEQVVTAALGELDLSDEQRQAAPDAIRRALDAIA